MTTLHVLVGIPASGKSSWAKSHSEMTWISSDNIRTELWGSENDQRNPQKVFNEMFKRTVESLRAQCDTIYDATNLNRKRRISFIKEIRKRCENVTIFAHIFATPFETCLERNAARARHVPEDVMVRMYKQFTVPSVAEGFDCVFIEGDAETPYGVLEDRLSVYCDFEQENSHHKLTVGEHCLAAERYLRRNWAEAVRDIGYYMTYCVTVAALYHDIGKPFCKTNVKRDGTIDKEYHYYSHENCGAYDFLCYANDHRFYTHSQVLEIALLINLHVVFYGDKVHRNRMKELYGENFWKALEWLHKADAAAH